MSWFKYGVSTLGRDGVDQKYLAVCISDDEGRLGVEAEIAKNSFDRLIIQAGNSDNLDFLSRSLQHGPGQLLIQGGVESLSGIDKLTNMVDFKCDLESGKPYPYFGTLINLEKCWLVWDKGYDINTHDLFTLPKLRELTLRSWSKSDLIEISHLTQLEKFDLRQCAIKSLDGVRNLRNLRILSLMNLPKLSDVGDLKKLGNLEEIHIEKCPGIEDFTFLSELRNMRNIFLDKVKAGFENLNWLKDMRKIDKICLSCETSKIDWAILFNHSTLKNVALRSHEGYSVPDDEILKIAESASRKVVEFKRIGTKKIPSFTFDLE